MKPPLAPLSDTMRSADAWDLRKNIASKSPLGRSFCPLLVDAVFGSLCAQLKITDVKLYTVKTGDTGARGAAQGESQYWGGGWQAQTLISNPMSVHPKYAHVRSLWMGGGQDPFVIEIFTDEGASGFCANYGGGAFACSVVDQHLKRFLIGQDPFNIELIWDQMNRSTLDRKST